MIRITFISDTHTKHGMLNLPGGDLLIHAGDVMSTGYYPQELIPFCKWFENQYYDACIFIAGNHDRLFQMYPEDAMKIVDEYGIDYLQDDQSIIDYEWGDRIKIWGSPWQPEFFNWAFNLPRNGDDLKSVWNKIPEDTDILVTHGPPFGHLDTVKGQTTNLGCELLRERIDVIKPKIHVFGHIHTGYGYKFDGTTHFINASVLDERYYQTHEPLTVDWDPKTNELTFIKHKKLY